MRKTILASLAAICMFVTGCGVVKPVAPTVVYRDSIKVEYRERIVHDTVDFVPPEFYRSQESRDTLSVIENDYAKTTAVWHDGTLSHDLQSKPAVIRVPVAVPVRDTVIIEHEAETKIVEKEVEKKLTPWQSLKMRLGGWVMLALLTLAVCFAVRAFVLKKNSFR